MPTTQNIVIDLNTRGANPVAFTHQGDTARSFVFEVYNNGETFSLTGYTAKIAAMLPADKGYHVIAGENMATGTISDNTITATLPAEFSAKPGNGVLTIILTGSGASIRPINVDFRIQKSADAPETIAGASDFVPILEQYIAEDMATYINAWLDEHPDAAAYYITCSKLVVDSNGILSLETDTDEIVEALDLGTLRSDVDDLKSDLASVQDVNSTGFFAYNSFSQGQRLQTNPTAIQSVDNRCTTKALLRLHKGDAVKIAEITSGHSIIVLSSSTSSGWITGTLNYNVPSDGEYWVNIKNGDNDISPSDITYSLSVYVNTIAVATKREVDNLSNRIQSIDGKYYLDPNNFEVGAIQISSSGWNYPDNNTTRVRSKQGVMYSLNVGDIISLSDYSNAKFYLGWLNSSNVYKSAGWNTNDYTVTEAGDYVILLCNVTETAQTSIEALFGLLSIKIGSYKLKTIDDTFDKVEQEFVDALYGTSLIPTWTNQMYNISTGKFTANANRVAFDKPYPVNSGWSVNVDVASGEKFYLVYMNKISDTGVLSDDYQYITGSGTGWQTTDKTYILGDDVYVFATIGTSSDTAISKNTVKTKITFTRNYGTDTADLPNYWKTYLNGKADDINDVMDDIGGIGDAFIFITDIHWGTKNQKHSPDIIKYLQQNTSLTSVYCGGDVIDSGSGGFTEYAKAFSDITVFTARGNHDQNPNAQDASDIVPDAEYYNRILKPIEYLVETNGKLYYYRDNPSEKIRYIFMDSGSARADTLDTTQLTWMQSALLALDSEWSALVIQHIVFNGADASSQTINIASQGTKTINAINSVYSQLQCTFIGIVSGHIHRDYSTTDATNGYPIIATSCDVGSTGRTAYDPVNGADVGTTDEQLFDVFCIDKDNRTIKAIRIGSGSDRTWNY